MTDQERRQLEELLCPENAIPFGSNPTAEVWPDTVTLVVGLGGVGIDALLETKGLVQRSCRESGRVKYLAIDADLESQFRRSSPDTGSVGLDREKGEWVLLNPPAAPFGIKELPEYIRSWLDMSVAPLADVHGAGGMRQQGRLRLFCNIQQVVDAVRHALASMLWAPRWSMVRIFVMAGVGGGTGSGTFLDLAYIARQLAFDLAPNNGIGVNGYLFLPETNAIVTPDHIADYLKVNAYTALQELDSCMNLEEEGARFTQRYSEELLVDSGWPPFEQVYLLGMPDENAHIEQMKVYRQSLQVAARTILYQTADETDKLPGNVAEDYRRRMWYARTNYRPRRPERKNHYSMLAEERLALPWHELLRCALAMQLEQMTDPASVSTPMAENAEQFCESLGLSYDQLLQQLDEEDLPEIENKKDLLKKDGRELLKIADQHLPDVCERAKKYADSFPEDFEKKLTERCREIFVSSVGGPAWVKRMLVGADGRKPEVLEFIQQMLSRTRDELAQLTQAEQELVNQVRSCQDQLLHAFLLFRRQEEEEFVQAVRQLFVCRTKQIVLHNISEICWHCSQVADQVNRRLFQKAGEILETMETLCADCREKYGEGVSNPLLTQVWNSRLGGISLPPVETLRQAVLQAVEEAHGNEANLKIMLDNYADRYLAPAVDKPLEWYLQQAGHTDLNQYIQQLLPQILQQGIEKCEVRPGADRGSQFYMISLPADCRQMEQAVMQYVCRPGSSILVQRSQCRDELRVQVVRTALPLWSLPEIRSWELAVANVPEPGEYLHLWPRASELPSPIPLRARARGLEDCPPAVRIREEEARRLFDACRTAGMIRKERCSDRISYWLVTDWTKDDHVYAEESSAKCVKLCVIVESMDSEQRLVQVRECFAAIPRAISLARTALKEIESLEEC